MVLSVGIISAQTEPRWRPWVKGTRQLLMAAETIPLYHTRVDEENKYFVGTYLHSLVLDPLAEPAPRQPTIYLN